MLNEHKTLHTALELFEHLAMGIDSLTESTDLKSFATLSQKLFLLYERGRELHYTMKTFNDQKKTNGWAGAISTFGGAAGLMATFAHPAWICRLGS